MRKRCLVIPLLLLLGSCTYSDAALGVVEGKIVSFVEQAERVSDAEAAVLKRAPCVIKTGAYWRALSPRERKAIDVLCGGDTGDQLR